ncbi:hypothetical protein LCGC14_2330020 [marine sediment metagenome]|uniref:Response regulatory domain-containing protein n=1 Tax=marine sediment metagenome TaxID=412755 RepID=A0A0F9CF39_9ZZZZ
MTKIHNKIDFLIIEDDLDTINLLQTYFEAKGYTCESAASVKQGLNVLKNIVPSVILLDILLPDRKGYEIIKSVKSNQAFSDVLIYFLTAIPMTEAFKKKEELGASGVIEKPFKLEEFDVIFEKLKNKNFR